VGDALALVLAIPLVLFVLLGAFALALARAAGRVLPVAFLPDRLAIEALLQRNLGGGRLGSEANPSRGGCEPGSGEDPECIAP